MNPSAPITCPKCGAEAEYESGDVGFRELTHPPRWECTECDWIKTKAEDDADQIETQWESEHGN